MSSRCEAVKFIDERTKNMIISSNLFYGGIIGIIITVFLTLIFIFFAVCYRHKLQNKFNSEYGSKKGI